MKNSNKMNVTATDFDLEAFDAIVKDIRNTHRAVIAIDAVKVEYTEKRDLAKDALQKSINDADMEGMTKHTTELRNAMKRLNEDPIEKFNAFDTAINSLADLVATEPQAEKSDKKATDKFDLAA